MNVTVDAAESPAPTPLRPLLTPQTPDQEAAWLERQRREEALRLAVGTCGAESYETVLKAAAEYLKFLKGDAA